VDSFVFADTVFLQPSRHCRHPSIRTLRGAVLFRSVPVGCSRFSVIQDNDKPLAVLLKYEHFLAMQEQILKGEE
jgi:hypothetical protein